MPRRQKRNNALHGSTGYHRVCASRKVLKFFALSPRLRIIFKRILEKILNKYSPRLRYNGVNCPFQIYINRDNIIITAFIFHSFQFKYSKCLVFIWYSIFRLNDIRRWIILKKKIWTQGIKKHRILRCSSITNKIFTTKTKSIRFISIQ